MRTHRFAAAALSGLMLFGAACSGGETVVVDDRANAEATDSLDATLDTVFGEDSDAGSAVDTATDSTSDGGAVAGQLVSSQLTTLPAEWPGDVPRPPLADVAGEMVSDGVNVRIDIWGPATDGNVPAETFTSYATQLKAAGFTSTDESTSETRGDGRFSRGFEEVTVSASLVNKGAEPEYLEFAIIYSS